MNIQKLSETVLELIRRTSCTLPPDALEMLELYKKLEQGGSRGAMAMDLIMQNIQMASSHSRPVCQDTGYLTFYIKTPPDMDHGNLRQGIEKAVAAATEKGYLRKNSVDSLTGKNTGNNLGAGTPSLHFQIHDGNLEIKLIQKGGGCENVSVQYKLPAAFRGKLFGRDLNGVRACILNAVNEAQGKGCAPGFLGVCIGGDRATGYATAKKQFLRKLDDTNPVPELAELEARVMKEANQLDIGPVGFGGKMSVGGCKIAVMNRLPASYYVTIAYMCWAFRRRGVVLDQKGNVMEWLYHAPGEFETAAESRGHFSMPPGKIVALKTPISEEQIRSLKVGDVVLLTGRIFTGRDAVHHYLYTGGKLDPIRNSVIYHCGPVMQQDGKTYRALAAGPTTSIREEPYQHQIIQDFGIKAIIGKGGMGDQTLAACRKYGAVYLHAIGGAAQIYAECIKKVNGVYLEQFGGPESVWDLDVEKFPAVVTMDSHGHSLHTEIRGKSDQVLDSLFS